MNRKSDKNQKKHKSFMDQLLAAFSSDNEEIQRQAAESMGEIIYDPNFYAALFETLNSHLADPLSTQLLLILHEAIRRAYKDLDDETKNLISSSVFSLAFEINDTTNSSTIIESIRFIFADETTNPEVIIQNSLSILLSKEPQPILKEFVSLSVISNWLLIYGVEKNFFTQEIHDLIKQLFPWFIEILNRQNCESNDSSQITKYSFLPLITKIIDHIIFRDPFLTFDGDLLLQIQTLIELLNDENCLTTEKSTIYSFLTLHLSSFLNPNCEENRREFHDQFIENCLPILMDHFTNHFPSAQLHASYCLELLNTCFKYNIGLDIIINLEYFYPVLVNSCILSDEDVENFNTVPEQFFSFCYDISSVNSSKMNLDILTPRYIFSKLFRSICSNYVANENIHQFIENLLEILTVESSNEKELEVKLFVLSLYCKHFQDNSVVFDILLQVLEATDSQIITSTCLAGMINLDIEKEKRLEIAVQFILDNENHNPCISLMALYLFDHTYLIDDDFPCELNDLIGSLLNIAGSICDPLPGLLLNALCRHYPQLFAEYSGDIIQTLVSLWPLYQESHDGDNIINGITNIICTLPSESEAFNSLVSPLINFVVEQFKENPNNECEKQMFELISEIIAKVKKPTDDIISLIPFFIELLQTGNFFYLIDSIVKTSSLIVQKSNIFSFDGFIEKAVELAATLLSSEELPSAPLLFIATIIQCSGPESIQLVEYCIPYLDSKSDEVFLSAICVISSAIKNNCSIAFSYLNPSIYSIFFENIERISNCDPVVLPLIINAISFLFINGVDERALESCFFLVQKLHHISEIAKQNAQEDFNMEDIDFDDDSFFEDDEADIISRNTVYLLHILPSDKLTLKECLLPILQDPNLVEPLPEEYKQLLHVIAS